MLCEALIAAGLFLTTQTSFQCVQYVKNYDGDTITFNIPGVHPFFGENIGVRLKGIDTPEMRGKKPCEKKKAIEARDVVQKFLQNASNIELWDLERGKYFRIVARVVFDDHELSKILIDSHLAVPYGGGTKPKVDWCLNSPYPKWVRTLLR